MPIKFTKEVSTHLFKYIRTIDISFNPFDSRTTSARELLRQVHAKRFGTANPKLKITTDIHNRPDAPKAVLSFVDDSQQVFDTQENRADEMLFQVHLKLMQMDNEWEMSGKNIDEL